MTDRKTFQKWAKAKGYLLDFLKHSTGGAYLDHRTQAAWEQWNADPYPDKDPWDAYELACKRIRELESWIPQAYKEGYQDAQNDESEGFDDDWEVSMAKMVFDEKMEPTR